MDDLSYAAQRLRLCEAIEIAQERELAFREQVFLQEVQALTVSTTVRDSKGRIIGMSREVRRTWMSQVRLLANKYRITLSGGTIMARDKLATRMLGKRVRIVGQWLDAGPQKRYHDHLDEVGEVVNVYLREGGVVYDVLFGNGEIAEAMGAFAFEVQKE